jgi:hypothetical protein
VEDEGDDQEAEEPVGRGLEGELQDVEAVHETVAAVGLVELQEEEIGQRAKEDQVEVGRRFKRRAQEPEGEKLAASERQHRAAEHGEEVSQADYAHQPVHRGDGEAGLGFGGLRVGQDTLVQGCFHIHQAPVGCTDACTDSISSWPGMNGATATFIDKA